jgi:hypothetical protein
MDTLKSALAVLTQTPHIREYLQAADPQALQQAEAALTAQGHQAAVESAVDRVNAADREQQRRFRQYRELPSAANFLALNDALLDFQEARQILRERRAARALAEKGGDGS